MSWQPANDPKPGDRLSCDAIETVIVPRSRDLGSFEVRRALPSAQRQMVGPFIFFDQMGPAEFLLGAGMDVRPHPHIGLSTVTYLFDGEIMHRDSLGTVLAIRPGELNWMTAGRGIAHSERTPPELRTGVRSSLESRAGSRFRAATRRTRRTSPITMRKIFQSSMAKARLRV
jgi:redox-sensitive bicupin YhaK (pirin superfamily)